MWRFNFRHRQSSKKKKKKREVFRLIFQFDFLQDELAKHLQTMNKTIVQAHKINPYINFEVFIHKVDGLNDDSKIDIQRQIYQRSNESLIDEGMEQVHLRFLYIFKI